MPQRKATLWTARAQVTRYDIVVGGVIITNTALEVAADARARDTSATLGHAAALNGTARSLATAGPQQLVALARASGPLVRISAQ